MAYTWENKPVISQIKVGDTPYYLKDAEARNKLDALSSATHFIGKTTTELTDGSTTSPVVIGGQNVTPAAGDIVYVEKEGLEPEVEFIFNGTKWQELGSTSKLGDLAFKDEATATYTPAGTVSQPTFTGTQGDISVSGTATGNITSAVAATGEQGNYTPAGTINSPAITVTPTTATGKLVTNAGTAASYTLPTLTTDVQGETLTISFDQGTFTPNTVPTLEASPSALTAVSAALATNPVFTGQATDLTFTGTAFDSTGTFTPEGTVSQPTFAGTEATITVS